MFITFFMKRPAATGHNACIAQQYKSQNRQKKRTVTSSHEAVNNLLEKYAIDEVIAETDDNMMPFMLPSSQSSTDYAEAL